MRDGTAHLAARPYGPACADVPVPRGVARAIAFMRENLARSLSVDMIATVAAIPERTLRRQFRHFTGQSLAAFHRDLRLDAARRALNDDTDVTVAAGAHGFSHFSHFTAQYRRRFGKLPSETLQMARAIRVQLPPRQASNGVTLAVLPFSSASAEEAAVAAATSDRLISLLGRARWLNVLGTEHHLPSVKGRSSAQYALRGRAQSIGGRLQLTVRLFEVSTGRHIWGNAFEGVPERALELEERVTKGVAASVLPRLREAASVRAKRRIERDPALVDRVRQAFRAVFQMTQSASDHALENLDRAQSIDPEFPLARAVAAWCHAMRAVCFFGDAAEVDRGKARHLIALTLSMDNEDPLVLAVLGNASTVFGDLDLGEVLVEKCLAIDPDCMMAWQRRGWIANYRGRDTAFADFHRALALTPGEAEKFNTFLGMSWAHVLAGNYAEAADWAVRGLRERPAEAWSCRIAAVAQVRCGQMSEARRSVARMLRQYPGVTVGKIIDSSLDLPANRALNADALESAGLPV
jgi:adenylate cyclase